MVIPDHDDLWYPGFKTKVCIVEGHKMLSGKEEPVWPWLAARRHHSLKVNTGFNLLLFSALQNFEY